MRLAAGFRAEGGRTMYLWPIPFLGLANALIAPAARAPDRSPDPPVTLATALRLAVLLVIGAVGEVQYVSTGDPGFLILVRALAVWPLALAVLNPLVVLALTSSAMQCAREALGSSVGEVVAVWSGLLGAVGSVLGPAGVLHSGAGRRSGA